MKNPSYLKVLIIYLTALLVGCSFVLFATLSSVITNPKIFNLNDTQFGNLFLPQTLCMLVFCLAAPFLVNRFQPKNILGFGMICLMICTGGLRILPMLSSTLTYPVLLVLVGFNAVGFGLMITTLAPVSASLFPKAPATAILIMEFVWGFGTFFLPLIVSDMDQLAHWQRVPSVLFVVLLLVFLVFSKLNFPANELFQLPRKLRVPRKMWIILIAIIFYGFIEGTFGGFGAVLLKSTGLNSSHAALGLSLFWAGLGLNPLLVGVFSRYVNLTKFYLASPLVVAILLFVLPIIGTNEMILLISIFFVGFFTGSIFPGTISWGTIEFPQYAVMVSGFVVAADMIGTAMITQVLGRTKFEFSEILTALSLVGAIIFGILVAQSFNSKIKSAFSKTT